MPWVYYRESFESIQAGCIPIYWGDSNPEPDILNHDAILFYEPDKQHQAKLFQQVTDLCYDEKKYVEFCHLKPFKEDAADIIWEKLETLAKRLKALVY